MLGVLWGFEPISHGNHHIRVYMHHVCLIQSISARKVNTKLGTCSGNSQCQLQFGIKMVSIGWSGCEWLPSECKIAHFQAFPLLAPSGDFPAKNTVCAPYIPINVWFWPTLLVSCVDALFIVLHQLCFRVHWGMMHPNWCSIIWREVSQLSRRPVY